MIYQQLINNTTQAIVLHNLSITESSFERIKGLLGTHHLDTNSGLLITPCNSVHTWFMSYAIDVIYLDKSGTIKKIISNLKPWSLSFCHSARYTLELSNGNAKNLKLEIGQKLTWLKITL